jgi:hypothetical protein
MDKYLTACFIKSYNLLAAFAHKQKQTKLVLQSQGGAGGRFSIDEARLNKVYITLLCNYINSNSRPGRLFVRQMLYNHFPEWET